MNENTNSKQQVNGWWDNNKRVIKAGIACGLIGMTYGLIKGMTISNRIWLAREGMHVNLNISRDLIR